MSDSQSQLHVFCSDVHLLPTGGPITDRFLAFLESVRNTDNVVALHILGDLFEYWLGVGHELRPDYTAVFEALKATAAHCEVNFLYGNRDFLVHGRRFEQMSGMKIRGEEHCFEFAGKKIKLRHGDHLCTRDVGYQRFRRFIRSPIILTIARFTPLSLKRKVAQFLRSKSKKSTSQKSMMTMDFEESAVQSMYEDGTEIAVCGHIHREHTRAVTHKNGTGQIYVLGAWHDEAPFLVCNEAGQFRFCREKLMVDCFSAQAPNQE